MKIKYRDYFSEAVRMNKKLIKLIDELSKVRVYNSCGVFQGVMIRDNKKAYKLILKARKIMEKEKAKNYEK